MKTPFIKNSLFQNAYQVAVSNRNKEYPVFDIQDKTKTTYQFKLRAEVLCNEYAEFYKKKINTDEYIEKVSEIKDILTIEFEGILNNNTLRFVVTQKCLTCI
ncbi:MAG: hypothetical protein Q8K70_00915 [Bacteroidota bacterium]|nr:hypothetical protein [Bacteroidota bacterium]